MSDLHNGGTTAMTAYEAMLESLRLKRSPRVRAKGGILIRDDGAFYSADGWTGPHVVKTFAGMPVEIENPAGTVRSGVDRRGKAWSVRMMHDYGFVRGTKAIDGDAVDVFLGPDEQSNRVFIVHQNDPYTGNFDEDKCLLGWKTPEDAKAAYLSNYDSPKFFRSMTEMTLDQFKNAMRSNARGGVKRKRKMGDPAIGPMFSADTGEWRKEDQVQSLGVTQLMPEIPKSTGIETAIDPAPMEIAVKTALGSGNYLQELPTNPVSADPIITAVPMESTAGTGTEVVLPTDPYAKLLADTIESKPEFSADAAAVRLVNTAMADTEAPRVSKCPECGVDASGEECVACGHRWLGQTPEQVA